MIAFLFNTRIGQALCLAAVIGLCWWGFSTHYEKQGYQRCQGERVAGQLVATLDAIGKQNARDAVTSKVIQNAKDRNAGKVKQIESDTTEHKTEVRYVYRERPATVAVASCVELHPVDGRVQSRLRAAVAEANAAAGERVPAAARR